MKATRTLEKTNDRTEKAFDCHRASGWWILACNGAERTSDCWLSAGNGRRGRQSCSTRTSLRSRRIRTKIRWFRKFVSTADQAPQKDLHVSKVPAVEWWVCQRRLAHRHGPSASLASTDLHQRQIRGRGIQRLGDDDSNNLCRGRTCGGGHLKKPSSQTWRQMRSALAGTASNVVAVKWGAPNCGEYRQASGVTTLFRCHRQIGHCPCKMTPSPWGLLECPHCGLAARLPAHTDSGWAEVDVLCVVLVFETRGQ